MEFGIKLMSEIRGPAALVEQAVLAEEHGLAFCGISDHYLPWLSDHGHSPFAWSVLGAIAQATSSVELVTMVTCPIQRYHPALVAQMAATTGVLSGGRFTLGLGSGEELNEHIYGQPWPAPDQRHEMLTEAIGLMRALWSGERTTIRGQYFDVDRAQIYDLPDDPIDILVAVSGPDSVALAAEAADGVVGTDPDPELLSGFAEQGGDASRSYTELPFGWAPTREEGAQLLHRHFRFGALGWPVMSELPDPRNFDAATASVTPEAMAEDLPAGPDPEVYVAAIRAFADAGYGHLAILPVGDDVPALLDFFDTEVRPRL